ncbi:hypothetical protein EJ110_NYTH12291 [Nymphaea thermarum]|nr:hypothetical protein EJ110_NYTH12291 [Nymphaea thermarum]
MATGDGRTVDGDVWLPQVNGRELLLHLQVLVVHRKLHYSYKRTSHYGVMWKRKEKLLEVVGMEGSSKNWDVNGEEFNFEGDEDLQHLNSELNEPCAVQEVEVDKENFAEIQLQLRRKILTLFDP